MRDYKHPPGWEVLLISENATNSVFRYIKWADGDEDATQLCVVVDKEWRYDIGLPSLVSTGSLLEVHVHITRRRCDYVSTSRSVPDAMIESECYGWGEPTYIGKPAEPLGERLFYTGMGVMVYIKQLYDDINKPRDKDND